MVVRRSITWALLAGLLLQSAGCQSLTTVRSQTPEEVAPQEPLAPVARHELAPVPTEKSKTSLPAYVIEAPDILLIDVVRMVPKPPYHLEPLDVVQILVAGTLLGQDISGPFPIDPGGEVNLGPAYGRIKIGGMTLDEATTTIDRHLRRILKSPDVSVTLAQSAGQQQITGEHKVAPDGTVNLGIYGRVFVSGMTIEEARTAIQTQLSKFLEQPKVSLDIYTYQSKVYYIISQTGGFGDQLTRIPITGNETVLDAVAQIQGLTRNSSRKIWIARPAPSGMGCDQILNVDWTDITAGASTATNYQLMPGDRVFIAEYKLATLDAWIERVKNPFERVFGFGLLGAQTIQTMSRFPFGNQGNGNF